MIGVIAKPGQLDAVEEFFQLFKTPWEFYRPGVVYSAVIATREDVSNVSAKLLLLYGAEAKSIDSRLGISRGERPHTRCLSCHDTPIPIYGEACTLTVAGDKRSCVMAGAEVLAIKVATSTSTVIRFGYDLFDEVGFVLSNAQPLDHAGTPTLDVHINMLRTWILEEGSPLIEIPPVPAGYRFTACLTHDIDFVGIRNHKFDHTMFGFIQRSTVGALGNLLRGKITVSRLLKTWVAALSLPMIYLGWAGDFWEPFKWYLKAEKGLPVTYFLIPFKRTAGSRVPRAHASRRAAAYDIGDLGDWPSILSQEGCEVGVHGIDAWHDVERGVEELNRVRAITGQCETGIRMHWLLQDGTTAAVLEEAGFAYDSTAGYNETVGYRNGTTQVFRPLGVRTLLELPMHIQDGALFFRERLDLSESEAQERCQPLVDNAQMYGGVLTLLWHDRSHGPERFWGDFYLGLIQKLKSLNVWFGSAGQVVGWFRKRRDVRFEQIETSDGVRMRICHDGGAVDPPLRVRVHAPVTRRNTGLAADFIDMSWDGTRTEEIDQPLSSSGVTRVAAPSHL